MGEYLGKAVLTYSKQVRHPTNPEATRSLRCIRVTAADENLRRPLYRLGEAQNGIEVDVISMVGRLLRHPYLTDSFYSFGERCHPHRWIDAMVLNLFTHPSCSRS